MSKRPIFRASRRKIPNLGIYSKAVFGRSTLPKRCLVYAGVLFPASAKRIRRHFDRWERIRGYCPSYTFAKRNGSEYLLVFNVYGAALMLETLHLLREGGARKVFFIGSMGSMSCPIGTIVLPETVEDQAGIVLLDDKHSKGLVKVPAHSLAATKQALESLKVTYRMGRIVSVPCVLHEIKAIKKILQSRKDFAGHEMELSTFHYFSNRLGLHAYSLLYVSDSKTHEFTSSAQKVIESRRLARRNISKVALKVLS
jgi:purine-nucleoside phosphorylase